MHINLENKTALITGGSRGLGKAMALRFAASGARVLLLARDPVHLEQAVKDVQQLNGGAAHGYVCDISVGPDLETVWADIQRDFGSVDILVNNAGTSQRAALSDVSPLMLGADMDLKLVAALRLAQMVLPGMAEKRWGRIINVVSIAGKAPSANGAPTAISRAAGLAMSKIMAGEYAQHNVLVNALCVGLFHTSQWARIHAAQAPDMSFDDFVKQQAGTIPLGRLGDPEEFANIACFLASEYASYITGCAINVDGGKSPVM